LEVLEQRMLLSAAVAGRFLPQAFSPQAGGSASPDGFTPAQIRAAYGVDQVNFNGTPGSGAGQTIAIVTAYSNPNLRSDLQAFDAAFAIPDPTMFIVNQTGGADLPGTDPVGPGGANFEQEACLDVQWAHAIAPGATLLVVEADDPNPGNIFAAVDFARHQPGVSVISMSFGTAEATSETNFDAYFTTPAGHTPITFLASTGDLGMPATYPAFSPNVVAVGGTSLTVDASGNYVSESGWSKSGGGSSNVESQPAYQNGIVPGTMRGVPDVSFVADPTTGVSVYDSYNNGVATPWHQLGGTSLAAPAWAGLFAVADQGRALIGQGTLD
jgi:subtilase family serine protease